MDAVNGLPAPESVRQVAAADRLVVTKTDLPEAGDVGPELGRLNPTADVLEASFGDVSPDVLFGGAERDLRELAVDGHAHADGLHACCLLFEEELDWTAFGIWLTMLLQSRG